MTKIFITYHPCWTDRMPSWAASKYSPNLTNSLKIQTNLNKLKNKDRFEWQQNMHLIKNAIVPAVFENNLYIHVEKLSFAGSCIVLSMTIDAPHQSKFFCGFILSSTLNLDSIYFVEKIMNANYTLSADEKKPISTKISISDVTDANNKHSQEPEYDNDDTENVNNGRNISIYDKDCDDDDDPNDEKFLYALALKEPPKMTADKALSNGLEWYSFFLPKQNEEETTQNDNLSIINASTPAFLQKMNK